MNYLLIEKNACLELVQNRFYQNNGFSLAQEFVSLVRGRRSSVDGLSISKNMKGVIVCLSKPSEDAIVFDFDTLSLIADCNDSDLLIALQKTLRFCVKYWESLALSSSEMIIKNSTKAVIFPFSYVANNSGYRITIEREPNAKRLAKRTRGRYLLAYKSGKSEGEGVNEETNLTNFRKAYEDFSEYCNKAVSESKDSCNKSSLSTFGITTLNINSVTIPAEQGFESWKHLLTDDQKKFVNSDWSIPHRLEGPAGTGKTLCLVLKAINTLNTIGNKNEHHKSIFVVPSDELAETIKNRFFGNGGADYIVDSAEKYLEKKCTISVITLQKLCAQLLNYDIEESEFLDRDSVESKNTQLLYLDQIIWLFAQFSGMRG